MRRCHLKCPYCQTENRDAAEFCSACGKPIKAEKENRLVQENPFRITRDRFIDGIRSGFPASYLTVLSIIQGVAFGALIINGASAAKEGITISAPFLILISFGNLIIVWYEYSWLVRIYTWEPTFVDAMIPFILGALEALPTFFFESPFGWTLATVAFTLAGAFAFWNDRRHATPEAFDDYKPGLGEKCSKICRRRSSVGILWSLFVAGVFSSLLPLSLGAVTSSDHLVLGVAYSFLAIVTYTSVVWSFSEMSNEVLRLYEIPTASPERRLHKIWHKAKFLSLEPCNAGSPKKAQPSPAHRIPRP